MNEQDQTAQNAATDEVATGSAAENNGASAQSDGDGGDTGEGEEDEDEDESADAAPDGVASAAELPARCDLVRHTQIVRDAFADALKAVAEQVSLPILSGAAPPEFK